jgi:hypothetical protein
MKAESREDIEAWAEVIREMLCRVPTNKKEGRNP